MSKVKEGDRVRIVHEATVTRVDPEGRINTRDAAGTNTFHPAVDGSIITLIEPKYESEGIYMDDAGIVWRRTTNNGDKPWQKVSRGATDRPHGYYPHDAPARPLRRMRPE